MGLIPHTIMVAGCFLASGTVTCRSVLKILSCFDCRAYDRCDYLI
jgi:hypothetical protein